MAPGGGCQPTATLLPATCAASPVGAAGAATHPTCTTISFDGALTPAAVAVRTRTKYWPFGTPAVHQAR